MEGIFKLYILRNDPVLILMFWFGAYSLSPKYKLYSVTQ